MWKYTIFGAPRSKKNSSRLVHVKGRTIIMPSKAYKDYEKSAEMFLEPMPDSPIDFPVNVQCVFYMPTRRPVDCTNLISSIDDILVKHKVLSDDNRDIVASHDGSLVLYDKEHPRAEITITEKKDYEQWKQRD